MFYYDGKPIKKVGLLGVGKSNFGIYSYLSHRFPDISYTVRGKFSPDAKAIPAQRYFFGDEAFSELDEDILFLSPSARRDTPELLSAKEEVANLKKALDDLRAKLAKNAEKKGFRFPFGK